MTAITTASFIANTMLYLIIERLRRRTLSRVAYCFIIFACFSLAVSFYIEDQEKAKDLAALSSAGSNGAPLQVLSDEEAREQTVHMARLNAIYEKFNIDLRNISTAAIKAVKPKDEGNWRLWLGMILKYSVSTCYHTIYVLSVESFPTVIRQLSVGTCSVASRFASILSPFTKELVRIFLFLFLSLDLTYSGLTFAPSRTQWANRLPMDCLRCWHCARFRRSFSFRRRGAKRYPTHSRTVCGEPRRRRATRRKRKS